MLRTAGGSRVISQPGSSRGVRGYSCDLVVIDEASWVTAETMNAARPLVAATRGRIVIQSTPGVAVGPFFELCQNVPDGWAFMKVRSDEVPTIDAEFLARERRDMAEDLFNAEYMAEFSSGLGGNLFNIDALRALVREAP
jgi:hypothetical protein